jgi:hypothetical protein
VIDLARMAALIAVLGTAAVFGTDVFCAMVQRPALAAVDDRALVAVMGNVHRYGDRRMPVAGRWAEAVPAGAALFLLLTWLVLYARISAPINRQLAAAARSRDVPSNARALQDNWDRIINARAIIQGLAVTALCLSLTM